MDSSVETLEEYESKADASKSPIDFQLDMRPVAGSVSPPGRDAVLLSSQGIHIVDLDQPSKSSWTLKDSVPGTPIDVQWHPSSHKPSTIFSATSAKLLVWDLQQAVTHAPNYETFESHERAITSLDGSSLHPGTVATGGLDGYTYVWDIRTHRRPAQKLYDDGLSVHKVKLSPHNENHLASAHGGRFHIWDLRHVSRPVRRIKAHPNRVRDLQWNPQARDLILTCSSDCTVKFWNWSRPRQPDPQSDVASASEALDRTLETDCPIGSALHTSVGQGVVASGDDLFLFDCRIRAISDRKAKVAPVYTWDLLGQTLKPMGIRVSQQSSLQYVSLVDNALRMITLTPSLLTSVGAEGNSVHANSSVPKLRPGSYRNYTDHEEASIPTRNIHPIRNREDFSGVVRIRNDKATPADGHLQNDESTSHNTSHEREVADAKIFAPPPTITATDNLNSIDDEDDDFAIISGDIVIGESSHDPSKIVITPPPRFAGATFAPNGSLVIFAPARSTEQRIPESDKIPNYRGLASYLLNNSDDAEIGDAESSMDFRNISFSRMKGTPPWYARRSDWMDDDDAGTAHDQRDVAPSTKTHTESIEVTGTEHSSEYIPRPLSRITIDNALEFVPAKKQLAEEYTLHGSPYDICEHNKLVCERHGLDQHAKAWSHAAMVLKPVAPLRASSFNHGKLVVAKRNLVEIKRRDGHGNPIGVDYAFDEPTSVTKPLMWAPVEWQNHPFGQKLVKKMLHTFECQGDVQMLAMLTYVFSMKGPSYKQQDTSAQITSGAVRIRFKSKNSCGGDKVATDSKGASLLDHHDHLRHCAWRQNYADQLYAWGMTFARLEILQANGNNTKTRAVDEEAKIELVPAKDVEKGPLATCTICWEIIQGLCVTCPGCAHSTHPGCSEVWAQEQGLTTPCASGCGCVCGSMDEG